MSRPQFLKELELVRVLKELELVRAAIGKENLFIVYEARKSIIETVITSREIMPICAGRTTRGNPAIMAWCFLRDAPRYFLFKRIHSIDPCAYRSVPSAEVVRRVASECRLVNFVKDYS